MGRIECHRFFEKVDQSAGVDGCHLWTGSKLRGGYGRFSARSTKKDSRGRRSVTMLAHRFSYEFWSGEKIPKDGNVLHSCRNLNCVNPKHLRVGSLQENSIDRVKDGTTDRKLSSEQVESMRHAYIGGCSLRSLASKYQVGVTTVYGAVTGVRYRDCSGPVVYRNYWD